MSDFKWGVIGTGNIARKFIEAAQGTPGQQVYALASRTQAHAQTMADKYGLGLVHNSVAALLADPQVEGVYISATNEAHFDLVSQALLADKPVLCEKPLMLNPEQTEQVCALSEERGVFLMEGLWTRFLPIYDQVREKIAAGEIGKLRGIRSEYFYPLPDHIRARLLDPIAGGSLLDIGVYGLAFATMFLGDEPQQVRALANSCGTQVDLQSLMLLRYSGDKLASIHSCVNGCAPMLAVILGEKGRIEVPEFNRAIRAHVYVYGEPDPAAGTTVVRNVPEGGHDYLLSAPLAINGFEYQIQAAATAIRAGHIEAAKATHATSRAISHILAQAKADYLRDLK